MDQEQGLPPASEMPPMPQQQAPQPPTAPQRTPLAGDIHTMPDRFMSAQAARVRLGGGGKRAVLVIVILAVVLGGIVAAAYFYLQTPGNIFTGRVNQTPNQNVDTNQAPPNANANTNANANVANTNVPQDDATARARDSQRITDLIAIAKALDAYHKRFNAYPQFLSVIPKDILAELPTDPLTKGVYTYTSKNNRTSYALVFDVEAQAQFKDKVLDRGTWEFAPEDFAEGNTNVQNTNQPPTNTNTTPTDLSNLDADGDGLTAVEERVFKTATQSPDTDADGFRDNIEVKNFYSPIQSGNVKLDQSGLVSKYTHATYQFGFFYPASWLVTTPPNNPTETLITADTGEHFSIQVSDNPDEKTSWEWYVENVSSDFDRSHVDFVTVAGREAVRTLDGLQVYVAVGNRVYRIVYDLNSSTTINYPNVFNLLIERLTIP